MIDHALAHHLGGMRGEHRHDQPAVQQRRRGRPVDAFARELPQRPLHVVALMTRGALAVLGQVREHREQHEAAHEGQRVVESKGIEAAIHGRLAGDPTVAIDRGGAD
jgi:hypothetical protein